MKPALRNRPSGAVATDKTASTSTYDAFTNVHESLLGRRCWFCYNPASKCGAVDTDVAARTPWE